MWVKKPATKVKIKLCEIGPAINHNLICWLCDKEPAVDDFMAGANTLVDKGYPNIAREMRENIQFVVLAIKDKTDLLTGDNPERKV